MKKAPAAKRRKAPKRRKRKRARAGVVAITLRFAGREAEKLRAWAREHKTTPRRYALHVLFPPAARRAPQRPETKTKAIVVEPDELGRAASMIKRAARAPDVERFHDRAFIASIYDHLERAGVIDISLDHFKRQLVQLHRAGLLRLTRADLVGAMDPDLVERSEAKYQDATFHFVALDS
jgi:hypothetical protein